MLSGRDGKAADERNKQQETERVYQVAAKLLKESVQDVAVLAAWEEAQAHWKTLGGEIAGKSTNAKASTSSHTRCNRQCISGERP